MKEVFGAIPRSRIALETACTRPWVSPLLSEVIVAHARNVRLIGESRKKDDRLEDVAGRRSGATSRTTKRTVPRRPSL